MIYAFLYFNEKYNLIIKYGIILLSVILITYAFPNRVLNSFYKYKIQKYTFSFNILINSIFLENTILPNPIVIPKYIRNKKNCNISIIDNTSIYLSISNNLKMYFQDYNKTRQCVVLVEEREPNIQLNINSKENRYIENHTKIYTILDVGYYDYENKSKNNQDTNNKIKDKDANKTKT